MARYILIDNESGYIWGDSADLDGKIFDGDAIEFARAVDASNHDDPALRNYEMASRPSSRNEWGYVVYRADVNGSDAVPVVWDGTGRETIEAVERDCEMIGFIRIRDPEE